MYGKSEGGALHLSSGWSDQARYNQTISTLKPGKYVFYYEGFNANNTNNALNSNYFGLGSLTAGDLEGSNNTFVYSDEKNFTYNEWKAVAFDFTLAKTVSGAQLNVGVIGGTGGSASTPKMWFDNVTLYLVEEYAVADYAALNAAIEAAGTKIEGITLGFEDGQYAPYNVAALKEALAAAEAIDQDAENLQKNIDPLTTALTEATTALVANDGDVDIVYNGHFAEANGTNPKGWTRSNGAWGQQITGLDASTGAETSTAWYYNTEGAWEYGKDALYTMPLAAHQAYLLTFKYRSHATGSNNWLKASVLNGEDGLAEVIFPGNPDATNFVTATAKFTTGDAGNYVLNIYQSGNMHLTDVSIVKVASASTTISEAEDYVPALAYSESVTLARTIKAGFNTVVLPFDLSAEQVADVFGESAVVYTYSEESDDANNVTINFTTKAENTIAANVPVLIGGATSAETRIISGVQTSNAGAQTVAGKFFDFVGTYEAITLDEGDYFVGEGALHKSAGGTSVKPFRAYIKPKAEAGEVKMFIDGNLATSIDELNAAAPAAEDIFNIAGQRVQKAQKGVYVVGGKKVVVK